MRTYLRNFFGYNRTNTTGHVLGLIAMSFIILIVLPAIVVTSLAGQALTFGAWFTFPGLFIVLAFVHFVTRPLVSAHYNGNL